jgi:hypothetical protein
MALEVFENTKELCYLYDSLNSVRAVNSRKIRWFGHNLRWGDLRNTYGIFMGKPL